MGLALEIAVVEDIHQGILVGLADDLVLVGLVEAGGSCRLVSGTGGDGLTAAHNAATAAGHDLDQVVFLFAGLHLLHDLPRVGKTGNHTNLHIHAVIGNGSFLDALFAADAALGNGVHGGGVVVLGQAAEHGLRHAAGDAENDAAAGAQAEGHIAGLRFDLIKGNAEVLDHPGQLGGSKDNVRILLTLGEGVGPLGLHLLGSTGHNGHHKGLLPLCMGGVPVILFDDGREHTLRRAAGGHIFLHLRELVVHELHPRGAAGGQQGQLAAVFHPVQELRGLLHDCQVGGVAGVENLIKAHAVQGCHHLAHGVGTVGQAEGIAYRHPDGGSDLGHDPNIGIAQSLVHLIQVGANGQGAGGTVHPALAAADALRLAQLFIEGGDHLRIGATVGKAQHAHALDLAANTDAIAAKDTLIGIPDNGGRGIINGPEFLIVLKPDLPDTHLVGQILEDALAGLHAGGAVPAVGSQQELNNELAVTAQPLGMGIDDHTVSGLFRAGGKALAPVIFHRTQAAGTEG